MFLGTRSKTPPEQLRCDSKRETIYTTPSLRPRARLSRTPTSSTEPELHAQPRGDSRRPSLGGRGVDGRGEWYRRPSRAEKRNFEIFCRKSRATGAEKSRFRTCGIERERKRHASSKNATPRLIARSTPLGDFLTARAPPYRPSSRVRSRGERWELSGFQARARGERLRDFSRERCSARLSTRPPDPLDERARSGGAPTRR